MEIRSEFLILSQVYLKQLARESNFSTLAVLEIDRDEFRVLAFEGEWAIENSDQFRTGLRSAAQNKQGRALQYPHKTGWIEPLIFSNTVLGLIYAEKKAAHAISDIRSETFKSLTPPLSALLAWRESPWSARLEALTLLYELQKSQPYFDWIGIYRRTKAQDLLQASLYLGEPTEHVFIPISKGICGAAIREEKTIHIPDVSHDPRFIACSLDTKSELVTPIYSDDGIAIAEIDIDSNQLAAFSEDAIDAVEECAKALEEIQGLF